MVIVVVVTELFRQKMKWLTLANWWRKDRNCWMMLIGCVQRMTASRYCAAVVC